jgi:transposase InsO family protein
VAPNILGREFTAAAPNLTWLSDITYVPTGQKWLYLAIVLDLYAREVVGWNMSDQLTDQLTSEDLKRALKRR